MKEASFLDAVLHPDAPPLNGLTDGAGRPAGRRFSVYRNNVAVSLTEALQTGFPAVAKVLGKENFKMVAAGYLRKSPPNTPIISQYGDGFDRYLSTIPPLKNMPWLPDLARLELALRHAYHAADARIFTANMIAALPQENLPALHLHFAPATFWIETPYPVLSIRAQALGLQPTEDTGEILITRPEFDPVATALPAGSLTFMNALRDAPLGVAMDQAEQGLDLTAILSVLLTSGALMQPEETP